MERRDDDPEATIRARELRRRATAWEAALYKGLRKGTRRWRRSHPFHGFFLDLYCDAARLAVECDGAMHDARRDAEVARRGVLTLRFTNVEIGADLTGCLERIVPRRRRERKAFGKRDHPTPTPPQGEGTFARYPFRQP